ncbi:hypothetical protein DSUL_240003 [Desulfovibrionales bacterium]
MIMIYFIAAPLGELIKFYNYLREILKKGALVTF